MDAREVTRLPFAPSTPAIARTRLAAFLTLNGATTEVIDDALIVLSEMIANAISHGEPRHDDDVEIRWTIRDDLLELSVHDGGQAESMEPVDFDEDSLSGRGLSIISTVADRWWVDMSEGTRVSAALTLTS